MTRRRRGTSLSTSFPLSAGPPLASRGLRRYLLSRCCRRPRCCRHCFRRRCCAHRWLGDRILRRMTRMTSAAGAPPTATYTLPAADGFYCRILPPASSESPSDYECTSAHVHRYASNAILVAADGPMGHASDTALARPAGARAAPPARFADRERGSCSLGEPTRDPSGLASSVPPGRRAHEPAAY